MHGAHMKRFLHLMTAPQSSTIATSTSGSPHMRSTWTSRRRCTRSSPLRDDEPSIFRSLNSPVQRLARHNRPDVAFEQNRMAQHVSRMTIADLLDANALATHVKETADFRITLRCGVVNVEKAAVLMYGDSSFASVVGETSQGGVTGCLTERPHEVLTGDLMWQIRIMWQSGRVRRVVRRTLAAGSPSSTRSPGPRSPTSSVRAPPDRSLLPTDALS